MTSSHLRGSNPMTFEPTPRTLEQFAAHYVATIQAPPNAWGQHISKIFGKSTGWILQEMFARWGSDASNAAIYQAFQAPRHAGAENL